MKFPRGFGSVNNHWVFLKTSRHWDTFVLVWDLWKMAVVSAQVKLVIV
jgi:hypothetical protein